MKNRYKMLDKRWKELLFAASGFGPNLLMVIMGAWFTDAINPSALINVGEKPELEMLGGACYILPLLFPILWGAAKMFDGIVDVPLAALTDNLKTKWGKRRLPILVCFIPMVLSYALCWIPIGGASETLTAQTINTVWIIFWAVVFFTTYTMSLIAFYGSLSNVCYNDDQRLRVSSFKSFFDTISYCISYALFPVLLGLTGLRIDKMIFVLVPIMCTMLIPLFLIKEGEKFEKKAIAAGYDITPLKEEKRVGIKESIKLTFKNKPFVRWCIVNCCSFFGLQMFLVSMNAMILGSMELSKGQMAILNTCAFAPVPLMLYMFNKLRVRKGLRFAYQTCLISFAICILSFDLASVYVMGRDHQTLQIIIGCIGGVIGSWSIGAFFMMPYLIPAQVSSVEEKLTGKNHSAMYFAGQALTTSIIGAIASSLVYENIKMLFISKGASGIVWAKNIQEAASKFNVSETQVFNFGTLIVPIFVSVFCILGFILAFKMPKHFSPEEVAKDMGLLSKYKKNKNLFSQDELKQYDKESIGINLGLFVLTGGIFGVIWQYTVMSSIHTFAKYKHKLLHFILGIILPPYVGVTLFRLNKKLVKECREKGIKCKDLSWLYLILGLCCLNVIPLIFMQRHLNKLFEEL